jgi:transcriptional regulator with XRE-family HTH domain
MDRQQPAYKDIAPRLRGLRDAMDLSAEEMATQAGVTAADVLKYESGDHEIPVSYLFNVAQAFQVDLTVLMSGKEAHLHTASLVKKGKGMSVERRKDYDYKSLAYRFIGRKMEPFVVTVPPKDKQALTFNEHQARNHPRFHGPCHGARRQPVFHLAHPSRPAWSGRPSGRIPGCDYLGARTHRPAPKVRHPRK